MAFAKALGMMRKGPHVIVQHDERRLLPREPREYLHNVSRESGIPRAEAYLHPRRIDRAHPRLNVPVHARPVPEYRLHEHTRTNSRAGQCLAETTVTRDRPVDFRKSRPPRRVQRQAVEGQVHARSPFKVYGPRRSLLFVPRRKRRDIVERKALRKRRLCRQQSTDDCCPSPHFTLSFPCWADVSSKNPRIV